jgi:hypothetical protein
MRCPHKLIGVTNRLEGFDEIDRLMHSTEAAIPSDCCSVLNLSFNIPDLALLLIEATIDLLKPSIHLCESSIHLLLQLCKSSIHLLFHQFKLLVYSTKLRSNKLTLVKKFLPHSLVVSAHQNAVWYRTRLQSAVKKAQIGSLVRPFYPQVVVQI